jgi:hypothetical protein
MPKNAVLANLTIHKFSNEVNDKATAATVARANHASISEDKYIKKRIPKAFTRGITTTLSQVITTHRTWTSPWFDGGIRILPAKLSLKYLAAVRDLRSQLDVEVMAVAEQLPAIEADQQRTRGNLYIPGEIPSRDAFINAFKIDIDIIPFPVSADFRVDFITDQFKDKYDKTIETKLALNTPHVANLFVDPMKRLLATANKKSPRFYQSTFDKLAFAVEVAPDMLFDEDVRPALMSLCEFVEDEILGYDLDDIRTDQNFRERFIKGLLEAQTMVGNLNDSKN